MQVGIIIILNTVLITHFSDSLVTEKFDKTKFEDGTNSVISAFESSPKLWINFSKSHGLETLVAEYVFLSFIIYFCSPSFFRTEKEVKTEKPKVKVLSSRTSKRKEQGTFAFKSVKKERKMRD